MKYEVIVNVNLCYEFEAKTAHEAYMKSQEVELPKEYVEDSRDTVKIIDEKGKEYFWDWSDNIEI